MREERDEGVQGLSQVKTDRSNLRKMRGGVWVRAERGFSLIELIGVLAVMAILASMTVPPILRQIRQAQTVNEDANLNEVARAIVEGIKATGTIPNPNVVANNAAGWFTLAQPYTALSQDAFLNVFPDNAYSDRRYYLEPIFDAYFQALTTYQTPPAGFPAAGFPVGALRILLVSSSRGISNPPDSRVDPVLPGNAGISFNQADYLALVNWNKVFAGGVVAVPILPNTPFSALWNGMGEYLHVKTVDLRPLFCRVTLRDLAAPPTATVTLPGIHIFPVRPGDPVNGQALGYSFDFVPSGGLGTAFIGDEVGTLTSSLNQRILINRRTVITSFNVRDNNVPIAGSNFTPALPLPPSYEINDLGIQPFPIVNPPDINAFSIYLIKGTIIKLYDGVPNLLLNIPVTTDMNFEYYNGSWTRVD
jgi:prepilin-type N-terminal cleavage/methylation domain-containing protein